MNIDIKDIITLNDDNKYVVCSQIKYQNNNYLYLIDINNNANIKFGLLKFTDTSTIIVELDDQQLIQNLLPLFFDKAKNILNN